MDKQQIKGELKKAEGKAKEAIADLTDNEKLKGEGIADQLEGEARKTAGDVKETVSS